MARRFQRALSPEQVTRRRWKLVGLGCGSLVALVVLIGLIIYAKATGGSALPREIRERAATQAQGGGAAAPSAMAAPAAPAAGAPAGSPATGGNYGSYAPVAQVPLQQQLDYVDNAVRTGQRLPVTLTIPDGELNQMIAEKMKANEEVRTARAYFGKGKAYLVALVVFQGHELTLTVAATPLVVNGGMRLAVESVCVGTMPAPAIAREKIQKAFAEKQDDWSPQKTGIYFQSIEVREGMAILTGQTVGKQ